jgi:DNA-binding transcriptional MerR regulator
MYIGKLAALTGSTRKAIRHYESIGLIPSPQRKGSYRVYTKMDVQLVKMIRRAQAVGFNLVELSELAATKAKSGSFPIEIANRLIAEKQQQLHRQKREIETTEKNLKTLRAELNEIYGSEPASKNST